MKITWLHTGQDGRSHFTDLLVPFAQEGEALRSPLFGGTGAAFGASNTVSPLGEFHNAPRRQWVVILTGGMEVEIGDGTVRRFGPGEVFLADDLKGQGHRTGSYAAPRCIMTVPVNDDAHPQDWKPA